MPKLIQVIETITEMKTSEGEVLARHVEYWSTDGAILADRTDHPDRQPDGTIQWKPLTEGALSIAAEL